MDLETISTIFEIFGKINYFEENHFFVFSSFKYYFSTILLNCFPHWLCVCLSAGLFHLKLYNFNGLYFGTNTPNKIQHYYERTKHKATTTTKNKNRKKTQKSQKRIMIYEFLLFPYGTTWTCTSLFLKVLNMLFVFFFFHSFFFDS